MPKHARDWLKLLEKSKPGDQGELNFEWTVFSPNSLSELLIQNESGFTEDITTKLLIPWGTEHDDTYIECLQILLSASLISYTQRDELCISNGNSAPPEPSKYRERFISALGGPLCEAYKRAFRILEEMNQAMRSSWVNSLQEMLTVINTMALNRDMAWVIFRDILVVLCNRNKYHYWPSSTPDDFLDKCVHSPAFKTEAWPWFDCGACSHAIRSAILTARTNAWVSVDMAYETKTMPTKRQLVLLDEKIWTVDKSTAPIPLDFPLKGVAESSNEGIVHVCYTSIQSDGDSEYKKVIFGFPAHRVFVSCVDVPNPAYAQRVAETVPLIASTLLKHAPETKKTPIFCITDKAEKIVADIIGGKVAIDAKCPEMNPDRVALDTEEVTLLSKEILEIIQYGRDHMKHITFTRNSKMTGSGPVVFKFLSTPARSGSSNQANVVEGRGMFQFDSTQSLNPAEHITRSYYGHLGPNGHPRLGHMRLIVAAAFGDASADVFEIEEPPGVILSYSGSFQNNHPCGPGTLIITKRGFPLVSITGSWKESGTEIDGVAQIAIFEKRTRSYYVGYLSELVPHGQGTLDIFRHPHTRKSYRGGFKDGTPDMGVLHVATQGRIQGSTLRQYSGSWKSFTFDKGSYATDSFYAEGSWNHDSGMLEGFGRWISSTPNLKVMSEYQSIRGQWKNGKPNGTTFIEYKPPHANMSFSGQSKDGLPHGMGTMKFRKDKNRREVNRVETGQWVEGRRQGAFLITAENGAQTKTTFAVADESGILSSITPKEYHGLQMNAFPRRPDIGTKKRKRIPHEFLCPILHEVMEDPHTAEDGMTYELWAIKKWLRSKRSSPMTNEPMGTNLVPNRSLKSLIKHA